MKRPARQPAGKRSGDILKDLSKDQLAGIGMVALAFNDAEAYIHFIVGITFELKSDSLRLSRRINGIDGVIELAKIGLKRLDASEAVRNGFGQTVGEAGFKEQKTYRDAIIHAQVLDAYNSIGISPHKQGRYNEILLTKDALEGVFARLVLLRSELIGFCNIAGRLLAVKHSSTITETLSGFHGDVANAKGLSFKTAVATSGRHFETRMQAEIEGSLSEIAKFQSDRRLLPPLPEFPAENSSGQTLDWGIEPIS